MSHEYLATGFAGVDATKDTEAYKHCLALLDSLPYFQRYKQRSYQLLALAPGLSLLEVGCGLGDDLFRMAQRLGPNGIVVGLDASAVMLREASSRAPAHVRVNLGQADARQLPFKQSSFDRCRVDRTLQHIQNPQESIQEMVGILKPGGLLLAYDNDWGTFSVSGSDREATQIIETLWENSFTNPWIGRNLKRYFLEAGLAEVMVEPSVSVIEDFDLADQVYNLRETVRRAVDSGRLPASTGEGCLAELQAQSRSGAFLCTLTAFTVTGMKP